MLHLMYQMLTGNIYGEQETSQQANVRRKVLATALFKAKENFYSCPQSTPLYLVYDTATQRPSS